MKFIRNILPKIMTILLPFGAAGQGIHIGANCKLVITGAPRLVLNNAGFVNDGSFSAGNSSVLFTASSPVEASRGISGTALTTFYNLGLNRSAGDLTLSADIAVTGVLTLNAGQLQLNNHILDLGVSGDISGENGQHYITGVNGGSIRATRTFIASSPLDPGHIGLEILPAGSPGALAGTFTVERRHVTETLNPDGIQSIQRSYTLTGTPRIALNLRLRFFYQDVDIFDAGENSMILWTSSGGSPFTQIGKDSNNTTANWVVKNNVKQLGHFVLADPDNGGGATDGIKPGKATASPLALSDAAAAPSLKIYPNPAQDRFTVDLVAKEAKEILIGLYDQSGRLLQQRKIYCRTGRNTIDWDLSKFAAGAYFLSVGGKSLQSIKIVKTL